MTPLRKYQVLLLATVCGFMYILCTEIVDRYAESWALYAELREKQSDVREPEVLAAERASLLERRKQLKDALRSRTGTFEDSPTGVLEFMNTSATHSSVKVESLVPEKVETGSTARTMSFKLSLTGPFHKIAQFVNLVETGPFALRVNKLEITNESVRQGCVKATCDGVVTLAL